MATPPKSPARAAPFPGVGADENRLYLVNQREGGITIYKGIEDSPNAVIDEDWTRALPKLAANHPRTFTGLEIHCHGQMAEIRLDPLVTRANVKPFGELLSRVLAPGSMIEVLACMVASWPVRCVWGTFHYTPAERWDVARGFNWKDPWGRTTQKIRETYPIQRRNRKQGTFKVDRIEYTNLDEMMRRNADHNGKARELDAKHDAKHAALERILGPDLKAADEVLDSLQRQDQQTWMREFLVYGKTPKRLSPEPKIEWAAMARIADRLEEFYGAEHNGFGLCRDLARASRCTVRAGWLPQFQDRTAHGQTHLIGDWEGWVFDFDADGLKDVHYYLGRPQANQPLWDRAAVRAAASHYV